MGTILDTIVTHKQAEVRNRRQLRPLASLETTARAAEPCRGFAASLTAAAEHHAGVIAEVKRGSPSLGLLYPDLDAPAQAIQYQRGGAAALSVLTDEHFFFGADADFANVRQAVALPMLRKDFLIAPYQLYESRALGADCVLLIMAILSNPQAREFSQLAHELGMDVLAETHSQEEVERALTHVEYDLLGINNRDLKNFATNQQTTFDLATLAPAGTHIVAESGLKNPADIAAYADAGIRRFLIGETFVRAHNPEATVRAFVGAAS